MPGKSKTWVAKKDSSKNPKCRRIANEVANSAAKTGHENDLARFRQRQVVQKLRRKRTPPGRSYTYK